MNKKIVFLALILLLVWPRFSVSAQDVSNGAYYIVQEGDSLNGIALQFGVSAQDLIDTNEIADANIVSAGTRLTIPGIHGVDGELNIQYAELGDSLTSLSRRYQLSPADMSNLNGITSPNEVYAGTPLILSLPEEPVLTQGVCTLGGSESIIELAARKQISPWSLMASNQVSNPWLLLPGDPTFFSSPSPSSDYTPISSLLSELSIDTLPIRQGGTYSVRVQTKEPLQLSGSLDGHPLTFFRLSDHEYVALQGIHAMAETGITDLILKSKTESGEESQYVQNLLLLSGNFAQDPPLSVDPTTLDPANTAPEEDIVRGITEPVTDQKYWQGVFLQPVDDPACIYSWYGNRRSYNGSEYKYFHTGVDYGVCANLNIYAPAAGRVVFTGPLTARGNATIIDHGWGVYSGIWHQVSQAVTTGDWVEAGQLIGEIGATGRVTGPHLHWEVVVNGVQVEPLDWLELEFPLPSLDEE